MLPFNRLYCLLFLFSVIIFPVVLRAQEQKTYSGIVSDSAHPVASANVFIMNEEGVLLSFAITNEQGVFQITLAKTLTQQRLWIEATCIGYKKERLRFDPDNQKYTFTLARDPVFLQGVTVVNRPKLQQMGDTLRYIVSSFAQKEDRSIGDVLRRMPGIKIMDDGTIYYNDKQIENLYIHGDDLMSGKYGTATKVIRKEMIRSVDVIQNHQPIKVLKDKVFSDKTSINLVLTDENSIKVSFGGSIGLGLPGLYDITANSILLNKKIKSINLASLNNAGVDYTSQLKSQGSGNMAGSIDKDLPDLPLSLSSAQLPNIARQYYFANRSRMFNFNNLYNLKNGFQLKANAQLFNEVNFFSYNGTTQNFTGSDTIVYRDDERLKNRPNAFNGSVQLSANKEKFYYNNTTQYAYWKETNYSHVVFNDNAFSQGLSNRRYQFSNDLHWMPALKSKTILELRWLLKTASSNNKQLTLYDGFISSISGHEGVNDSIIQNLRDPVSQSHLYVSGKRSFRWGTLYQNAGWIVEDHLMQSSLFFVNNGVYTSYTGDEGNHQRWRSHQYYTTTGLDFKKNKWSGTIQVPMIWQQIRDVQKYYGLNSSVRRLRVNPKSSLRRQFSLEKQASLNYNYSTAFGSFADTYIGSILKNYRNLSSSQGVLPFNRIHDASLSYSSQKSIQLFFFNADLNYMRISANTLFASVVTDSIEQTVLIQERNTQQRWSANAGVSKFIFAAKLNVSLKMGYQFASSNVILNNEPTSIGSRSVSTSLQFTKRFSNTFSLDYTGRYGHVNVTTSGSSLTSQIPKTVQNLNQIFKASFIPNKRLLVDLVIRHAIQKNNYLTQGFIFSDAKIRYTFSKKKFDLNIDGYNLFDVKKYTYFNADSYKLISNNYFLRGRMIMAKVDIYF